MILVRFVFVGCFEVFLLFLLYRFEAGSVGGVGRILCVAKVGGGGSNTAVLVVVGIGMWVGCAAGIDVVREAG